MADVPLPNNNLSKDVNIASTQVTQPVQEDTPLDVSAATLTVTEASALSTTLTNATGTTKSASAAGTGSANAAALTVADGRPTVTLGYDTSGAATITVEVSPDGGSTWYQFDQKSPGSAANNAVSYDVGMNDIRAYIDTALNSLHLSAKGT